ncbi:MAG TPA: hypothetical protein PLF96_14215, partial [Thermotogota bacterium]|nr:hypothetical protein [Thermotogota bacterium]
GASVTLQRLVVTNCSITGADGGALFLTGTSPTLTTLDATFSSNGTDGNGGAIFLDKEVYYFARNTVVTGNQAASGGGMCLFAVNTNSPNPTFISRNSTFSHNEASEMENFYGGGGGVHARYGTFSASETFFVHNTSTMAGGLYILNSRGGMENSVVSYNTVSMWAGGMMLFNPVTLEDAFLCKDSEFSYNEASTENAWGGGIALAQGALVTDGCSIFSNSNPDGYGGGVALPGYVSGEADYFAIDTQIWGNQALSGGGICVMSATFTAVSNVSISGNTAGTGGGISLGAAGTIYAEEMDVFNNSAQDGGGLYWGDTVDPSDEQNTEIFTNGNPWTPPQSLENPFSVGLDGSIHTTPVVGDPVQFYGDTAVSTENELLYLAF